jgi:RNA polymerase sigma factor (sigma-70 family)
MHQHHDTRVRQSCSTPYEQHRDYVLAVLARRCGWLDPSDREAIFHDAYAVFLEKTRDGYLDVSVMCAPQVRAYLTQTSLNKAMDESKRAARRRTVSLDDETLSLDPADPGRGLDERLGAGFDDARVREIVAELPERQQTIIKLRYFLDRTPGEVQRCLGISERVYRRELERATRHIARAVELVRHGTFCDSRRSLILAYVSGIAGPRRAADARRHVASCPACAGWVRAMRAPDRGRETPPVLARAA